MFDRLFSPLKVGRVTLPNRICFLAHRTNFARRGRLSHRHVAYYRRRAEGGCGLIIVGELSIHPDDRPWASMIEGYVPGVTEDYLRLTRAVHAFDTPIFAQLTHHGFQSNGAITRREVWGPSAMSDVVFGETAKAMEPEDMAETVEAFARASLLAREGGFDGLEIDMGPESLLRQFLSPISNHRQDDYGGGIENRMRFPLQVIDGVREAVGEDVTIGVRLCVDEKFWGGITIDESRAFAERVEASGRVDFFNVAVGTYYNLHLFQASMHTPFGFAVDLAEQLKSAVNLPVIGSHQIESPRMAEDILAKGQADAVGLIRNLICDPDAPQKAREGRPDDIRYCIRDNEGCIGRTTRSRLLSCTLNPKVGYETLRTRAGESHVHVFEESGILNPRAKSQKRVLVVGAGPAGLEAALAAGEKGHAVTVYEKEKEVGGQINLAKRGAGRQALEEVIRYQVRALDKLDASVITGVEVTPEWVLRQKPDAVIVATGSRPKGKPVPGEYGPPGVLNVWDVLNGNHPVGEKVLYVDENGGHHATATAELLADQGKKVTMLTSEVFIGMELAPIGDLYLTRQRLLQKGVVFACDVRIEEIDGNRVRARNLYTHEPVLYEGYDTIVLDMGNEVDDGLYKQLKGRVKDLSRCGDCVAPRNIGMAVFEGRMAGEKL